MSKIKYHLSFNEKDFFSRTWCGLNPLKSDGKFLNIGIVKLEYFEKSDKLLCKKCIKIYISILRKKLNYE